MAKQNVTFIERHVEKIMLGVAGAVLLGIAVFCLIGLHKVSVQGEQVGPQELYNRIRQQADETRERMKRAGPEGPGNKLPTLEDLRIDPRGSPYELWNLPTEVAVAYVPLAPPVPELKGEQRGKIRLAEILPPSPVVVRTGQASAKLEPPLILTGAGAGTQVQDSFPAGAQDWHWVTVFSVLHRKDQRDKSDEAQYAVDRQRLIVAGVEAERQERLPDGSWDAPQIVAGYSPQLIPVRKTADLVQNDDGTWVVRDQKMVADYKQLLDSSASQKDILRPAFQSYLVDYPLDWQVPAEAELPGVKLADFEVITEDHQGALPRPRPVRSIQEKPGSASLAKDRTKLTPPQMLTQANNAIEKQQYLEAEELLNQVLKATDAAEGLKKRAENLLSKNRENFEKAHQEAATLKPGPVLAGVGLGPDVEPLWLTDLNVKPGKTYRYRVRLLAFNPYVGYAAQLEVLEDAGKIVLEGQWSDWSGPIQVKPSCCLFFTSVRTDTNSAKVEIQDWVWVKDKDTWLPPGTQDLRVGDPVAFTGTGRHEFSYDAAVVVGLNLQAIGFERTAKGDGPVTYQEKQTPEIVLITADGQVEERTTVADNQHKRDYLAEKREYEKRRDAWSSAYAGQSGRPPAVEATPGKPTKPTKPTKTTKPKMPGGLPFKGDER